MVTRYTWKQAAPLRCSCPGCVRTVLPVVQRTLVRNKTIWLDRSFLSSWLNGPPREQLSHFRKLRQLLRLGSGQFLKAPQRLARQKKSFSRFPSTCQKAAVCVTPVRWLTQNLKQNCSRSCGGRGEREKVTAGDLILKFFKSRKTCCYLFLWFISRPFFFWKGEQMAKKCKGSQCSGTLPSNAAECAKH